MILEDLLGLFAPGRLVPAGFLRARGPQGWIVRRSGLNPAAIGQAIEGFRTGRSALRALKEEEKASVYAGLEMEDGRRICWKAYRSRRRGRRGLTRLHLLRSSGVPVPEPFFLWEPVGLEGVGAVLAMEDLAPRPQLDLWLSEWLREVPGGAAACRDLRPLAAALGAAIRDLHARRIWLDDLKTCNIFLDREPGPAPPSFLFIDVDGARCDAAVGEWQRVKNLFQINRSTPVGAGLSFRRAFWAEYRKGLPREARRRIRRQALERSADRPVVYIARQGMVEEPWPVRARDWPR